MRLPLKSLYGRKCDLNIPDIVGTNQIWGAKSSWTEDGKVEELRWRRVFADDKSEKVNV